MARRPVPSVNASLIHEARMLFQQFLGGRQENYYSMRIAEAKAQAKPQRAVCTHPVLKCCFCVEAPVDAYVVINGYSVCEQHEVQARNKASQTV